MNHQRLRYSFIALHFALGAVILLQSIISALHASSLQTGAHQMIGLTVLASVEAVAAVLFLIPRTLRAGGAVLLIVFMTALVIHGIGGEIQWALLVYAAGVVFVMLHGSAYGRESPETQVAT